MTYSHAFLAAITKTLEHEGGWVNDPQDPGGATNYGISLRWLRATGDLRLGDVDGDGDIDASDIRALSRNQVIALYHKHFWLTAYDQLDTEVAAKLFDAAVNMGPVQAHKLFQMALNEVRDPDNEALPDVRVDGVLGPRTVELANRQVPASILHAFRQQLAGFYKRLAAARPTLAKFLKGWLRRAAS